MQTPRSHPGPTVSETVGMSSPMSVFAGPQGDRCMLKVRNMSVADGELIEEC